MPCNILFLYRGDVVEIVHKYFSTSWKEFDEYDCIDYRIEIVTESLDFFYDDMSKVLD